VKVYQTTLFSNFLKWSHSHLCKRVPISWSVNFYPCRAPRIHPLKHSPAINRRRGIIDWHMEDVQNIVHVKHWSDT